MVQSRLLAPAPARRSTRRNWAVVALGVLAGLAYCSWPLGEVLNTAVAHGALASDLDASGEPFRWLFVGLDVGTGVLLIAITSLVWAGSSPRRRAAAAALLGFGALTAIDAAIPLPCSAATLAACGANLARPNLDDVLTGLALGALFAAALLTIASARLDGRGRATTVVIVAWSTIGLVFFAHHFGSHPAVGLQHLMLSATGALVIAVSAQLASPITPRVSQR